MTKLVLKDEATRLWPGVAKGDIVEYPFRSTRVWNVIDVYSLPLTGFSSVYLEERE